MIIENYSKNELEEIIKQSNSFRDFTYKIGYSKNISGQALKRVKKYLDEKEIDYSFLHEKANRCLSEKDIFCKKSCVSQSTLRRAFTKKTKDKYYCSICAQLSVWNNKPLTLILDHINGTSNDNRFENLRWVCPNCNQQLETTGFRKMRVKNHVIKKNLCKKCGKEISSNATFCHPCSLINIRKCERPSYEQLRKDIIINRNYSAIGRKYNISDNSVRKWCKIYGLPTNTKELSVFIKKLPKDVCPMCGEQKHCTAKLCMKCYKN